MSEEKKMVHSIFDPESENQIRSPEKLKEYIRVSNPLIRLVLLGLAILFSAFVVWGFFGRIPVTTTMKGIGIVYNVKETEIIKVLTADPDKFPVVTAVLCLPEATDVMLSKIKNKTAFANFRDGERVGISRMILDSKVLNQDEVTEILEKNALNREWFNSQMGDGNSSYRYELVMELEEPISYLYWSQICDVEIIIDEVPPISLLFD